jgi:hypothetical protein
MATPDKTAARDGAPLNGFLRRWRRNASRAGVLTVAIAIAACAAAVFALSACKSLFK